MSQTGGTPDDIPSRREPSWKSLFVFATKPDLVTLITALFLTAISGAAKPLLAIFVGNVFGHLGQYQIGESTSSQLLSAARTWCVALAGLGVSLAFFNGSFFGLWLLFGEKQARSARCKLFDGMLEKQMEWFDLRPDGIGSLLIRIQTQIRELQSGTSQPLGFFVEDTATILAGVAIAFYYSWKLTLVVLATIPVIMFAVRVAARARGGLADAIENQKRKLGQASKLAYTAILSIDTVKTFNGEDHEVAQYQDAINAQVGPYLDQAFINALQIGISAFGAISMFGISFWFALSLVQHGLTAANVVTSIYSCVMAAQAAEAILPHWLILAKGMSAGATLKDIVDEIENGRKTSRMGGASKPRLCIGDVEFRKVIFAYPSSPKQLALNEVEFVFAAKKFTYVVGKSGSGKSTLSNLLMKFYDPLSGEIFIDNCPIQTLDTEWLRNNVTLVQQQSILFDETLFRNIAFGRRSHHTVSKDDVLVAGQTAALGNTVNDLSEGLDTVVGAFGNSLSGGQMQRVAITRARLRDSPILVLDEATSALDPESQSLVMEAIRTWRRNKTTIIITHDISQIQKDDYVYVLEGGRVVQEGSRLLIEGHGAFQNMLSQSKLDSKTNFHGSTVLFSQSTTNTPVQSATEDEFDELLDPDASATDWYLSRFLGINQLGHTEHNNRRVSLGLGMAATYAHNLRAKNGLGKSSENQKLEATKTFSRPLEPRRPSIARTRSTQPHLQEIRRLSRRYLPEAAELEFELMEFQGRTTQENHRSSSRLSRISQLHKNGSGFSNMASSGVLPFITKQDLYPSKQQKETCNQKHVAGLGDIMATVPPTLNKKSRLYCVLGLFCCATSAACTPGFAYTFARLLATLSVTDKKLQSAEGRKWALIIIAIAALDGFSRFQFHYLAEHVAVRWVAKLRVEAFRRILLQPKSWFHKPSSTPERLNECLDRNAEEMRNIVGRFLGLIFYAGFMMVVAIIWAIIVSWKLTLVGLSAVPVIYLLSRAFDSASSKWERRLNAAGSHSGAVFAETFSNIRVVRAYTLENYFRIKHNRAALLSYSVGQRRAAYTGFFFGLNDCTTQLVTALVLYYGCVIAISQKWSVTDVITVATLLLFSATSAGAAIGLIPQIGQARATANFMLYLSHLPRNASHETHGVKQLESLFPVQLSNLTFSYPGTKNRPSVQILNGLNITFKAGTSTAIVGPSGCGKSTVASLILGLYPAPDPPHPRVAAITFAGIGITKLITRSLRNSVAIVPQQPVLFPTTVAQNISYGLSSSSPLNTRLNIICAAQAAGIHETIISMSDGYETLIGEGGQGLSGGQAQRVAIARALVRRPKLLILDEATSALDAESARGIRDLVAGFVERGRKESADGGTGMAVIIITHAIEMMRVVDRVVMLEAGRLVEEGGFDALVAHRGRFAKLVSGGMEIR